MSDAARSAEAAAGDAPVAGAASVGDDRSDAVYASLESVFDEHGMSPFTRNMARQYVKRMFSAGAAAEEGTFDRTRAWLLAEVNRLTTGSATRPPNDWQKGCPDIVPKLTGKSFWDVAEFPWAADVAAAFDDVKAEVLALRGSGRFQPYRAPNWNSDRTASDGTLGTTGTDSGDWNVFYLYLHNADYSENRELCPKTVALIDSIPTQHSHAFFSAMDGGTHITPHHGPTNKKLRVHLPIVVPEPTGSCRIRVGDETRAWKEGEVLVFDDSLEHEAFNDSDQPRLVLIFDVWHPELTPPEVKFLSFMQKAKMRMAKAAAARLEAGDDFYSVLDSARATVPDDTHIFPAAAGREATAAKAGAPKPAPPPAPPGSSVGDSAGAGTSTILADIAVEADAIASAARGLASRAAGAAGAGDEALSGLLSQLRAARASLPASST